MPVTNDCPYVEGIYDPDSSVLVLMSILKKQTFHMIPKLDDNGDAVRAKTKRSNGKEHREQRTQFETFQEYYITEKKEIENLIERLAVNSDSFNYKQFLKTSDLVVPEEKKLELVQP